LNPTLQRDLNLVDSNPFTYLLSLLDTSFTITNHEKIMSSTVALFVDYENIPDVRWASNWIDFAQSKGCLIIQNAYTKHWQNSPADGSLLKRLGFRLVNVILNIKNSVDCKCMFDCMEVAKRKRSPDIFIFVTGDGDYAEIINFLKRNHKKTIVFARRGSESKRLMGIADEFHFVDDLSKNFSKPKLKLMVK